jgi:hypothetical protein
MTIDKITEYIYAFRFKGEEDNELYRLFDQWNNVEFLHDFFTKNVGDLNSHFKNISVVDAVDDTIEDAQVLEEVFLDSDELMNFEVIFNPLHNQEYQNIVLSKSKAKRKKRSNHACWLRIYALKVDINLYVITGGAIKLTQLMQDRLHTNEEFRKIERCRNFLKDRDVFDAESFNDYQKELK